MQIVSVLVVGLLFETAEQLVVIPIQDKMHTTANTKECLETIITFFALNITKIRTYDSRSNKSDKMQRFG